MSKINFVILHGIRVRMSSHNTAIYNFLFTFPSFFSLIFGSNLDETTRSVYKENVRLNAALDFHLREGQELKKVCFIATL